MIGMLFETAAPNGKRGFSKLALNPLPFCLVAMGANRSVGGRLER